MTARRLALAAVLALGAMAGAAHAASPVEGVWRTAEGDGLVEVRPCGPAVCGYLIDHAKLKADPGAMDVMNADPHMRTRPMMDMLLLAHFTGGPQAYTDGRIYNPENGKTYVGELHLLDAARLKVTGCLVKPLCGSQVWKRVR
jgi:uncharacterized protein (DUF2147 family)